MDQFKNIKGQDLRDSNWGVAAKNQFLLSFMSNYQGDNIQAQSFEIDIRAQLEDVIKLVSSVVNTVSGESTKICSFTGLEASIRTNEILTFTKYRNFDRNMDYDDAVIIGKINSFVFEIYAEPTILKQIVFKIKTEYEKQDIVKVSWCFSAGGYVEDKSLYIEHKIRAYDEFYPWFKNGVDAFITEYLNDDAAVLVMHGPPGTGKTSFLKHLLTNYKQNATISYDEKVLSDDRFFIGFLTSNDSNLLIVEDADLLLGSREHDQNEVMSKFLNVSDGLIKIVNKKLIFTTNISQASKIDAALLRKGRCFANIEFRNLTPKEAEKAAIAAKLPVKDWKSQKSWSIADIFNGDTENLEKQIIVKTGFGS